MDYEPMSVNPIFRSMLEELRKASENIPKLQQQAMDQTATVYSSDRLVKVVVGARGQLVDLEIDPRVFRQPNSGELASKILRAANDAAKQVTGRVNDMVEEQVPSDLADLGVHDSSEMPDFGRAELKRTDAERYAERKDQS